ncbi:hypothetical protein QQ045_013931 [Rhodiola kirilowii]
MEVKGDVPVARSGHTVVRASSILILFGGEDAKRKKLSDLHMFDLKSLTWLPLHCTGTGPSPRFNHVAALYKDKTLLIFGGAGKSKTLGDLYSLDFGLRYDQQVHTEVLKCGYRENVYVGSALLDMYAKCKRMEDAYVMFDCMSVRNSVSWNALIAGYAELGEYEMVIQLFGDMEREGVHGKVMKCGLAFKTIVCNALINSYPEGGSKHVFDGMAGFQDLVSWNSLLAAYVVHKRGVFALKVFIDMQASGFEPDVYTFTSVISCSLDDELGKSFHGPIFKKGLERSVPISNSLMSMYLKSDSKSLEDALRIYESMEKRDQVSWNSILAGFSQNGLSENALECFKQMLLEFVEIDRYASSAVFKACSELATLQLGQQVHNWAMKMGTDVFDYVVNSLIFRYCKGGCIEDARKAFDETPQDSAIIWNSIILEFDPGGGIIHGTASGIAYPHMQGSLIRKAFDRASSCGNFPLDLPIDKASCRSR